MKKFAFMLSILSTSFFAIAQIPGDCLSVAELDSAIYVVNCNNKYGVFDGIGQEFLIKPKFEFIDSRNYYAGGYIKIKSKGKWGVSDIFGSILVKPLYDSIGNAFEYPDAMLVVKSNGKLGLVTEWGSEMFKPKYDSIGMFGPYGSDKALIKLNGLVGLISSEGYEFLPPQFDYIEEESKYLELCFRVRKSGLWGIVPLEGYYFSGNVLSVKPNKSSDETSRGYGLAPEYEELHRFGEIHPSLAVVRKNGKFGVIDISPRLITACDFDRIEAFGILDENCAIIHKDGKMGMIDLEGHVTLKPEYDSIKKVGDFIFEISKAGTISYVDPWGYEVEYNPKD